MFSQQFKGYLSVIIAALMWASSGAVSKSLFNAGITPFDLVQIRVTFASIVLGAFLLVFKKSMLRLSSKDIKWMFILGALIMALVQISYFYTISKLQLMTAILLQYLSPVIVAIFAATFWGERMTGLKVCSILLALSGCYLAVGAYNTSGEALNLSGILGGLVAAVSYAAYSLVGEKLMGRYTPWTVVFYALLFAALTWHLAHPPFKYLYTSYTAQQTAGMIYIVLVGTIGAFTFFFWGINYIRSTRAMITATLEPVSAGFIAWVFLGEKLETLQILGAILSVGAIVLLQIGVEQDSLAPDTIRKEIRPD